MGLIAPGELDRQIRLLRQGEVDDAHGDAVSDFTPLWECWAKMRPGGGRERFSNGEKAASAVTVFTVWWAPEIEDLNPKDKLEYPVGGRRYDIVNVEELGRREGLTIAAAAATD